MFFHPLKTIPSLNIYGNYMRINKTVNGVDNPQTYIQCQQERVYKCATPKSTIDVCFYSVCYFLSIVFYLCMLPLLLLLLVALNVQFFFSGLSTGACSVSVSLLLSVTLNM